MRVWAGLLACLLAGPVAAQDVRPIARPVAATAPVIVQTPDEKTVRPLMRGSIAAKLAGTPLRPVPRPYTRPDLAFGAQTRAIFRAEQNLFAFSPLALRQSMRPLLRPASIEAAAEERRIARLRGQVCGDPAIQGTAIGAVPGPGACGISSAVKVRSVAGVALSQQATMDCRTAAALKTWVERGVIPAVGSEGGGVAALRVVGHYSCRTRNHQPTARLSEHSFGRAIDIAGIRLRDGSEMTLLTDWNSAEDGAQLRQMWRAACGPFGTVLGPESDQFHRGHFHFDTAQYRSGPFCR
ncbi:extensin family protein [Cognatiyoonia sp. IB215182]|uniref:extensin-like domain-containing protein n=1 Tax=Cognatiyoonia sp. IB215182 TaxID=3097353 RepID=UPI002A142F26|nr:extensin family protein [Cognatiyoonia sp. IB215182]MDX8353797.1 extensin family protein [Cognatiyoonia sp. IB215182]